MATAVIRVQLPKREDFLNRLGGVDLDPYTCEWLFPLLMEKAEVEVRAEALPLLLATTIKEAAGARGVDFAAGFVMQDIPAFIDALVDDEEARAAAHQAFEEARR